MINCNFCGAPLDDDALFCANCGKKVENQGKRCPRCGIVVLDDSVFCAKCGTRLDEQVVTHIDSPQIVTPVMPPQEEEEVIYDYEKDEKARKWKTIILSIVLLVIIAAGSYFIYKNYNKNGSSTIMEREPIALKGSINETIGFSMKLHFNGNEIEGSEQYDNQNSKNTLSIKGTIDEKGNMVLHEFDNHIECGKYEGILNENTYLGIFTNTRGKTMSFSAQVVNKSEEEENAINNDAVYINEEDKERCIITYSQLLDRFVSERQSDDYMDETYFLFDITGDKIPELWVEVTDWSGEFFHLLYVYTVSDGQLNMLYKGNGGHPAHHAFYKGENYIILDYSHMGSIARYKYEYTGGKVIEKELFNGSNMDEDLPGYYELTEPHVITSDITDKELLNSF